MTLDDLLAQPFGTLADLVHHHALEAPDRVAFIVGEDRLTYGSLDRQMDRVAGRLQALGTMPGDRIAVCAATSIPYATVFLGALRAGVAVAPLAPSSTPEQIAGMIADSGAAVFFTDAAVAAALDGQALAAPTVRLDTSDFETWLGDAPFTPVTIAPRSPFHIIYSERHDGAAQGHRPEPRDAVGADQHAGKARLWGRHRLRCCRRRCIRTRPWRPSCPRSRAAERSC